MSLEMVKYEGQGGELVQFTANEVKHRLCPNIDDKELALVMALCQQQRLNPFTKDVYIIKYGNSPASIVTGKEVFTKRANANKNYEGFEAGVVFINGRGEVCQREGSAIYRAANETLVGGWCRVYVKGRKPFYDEVTLEEYSTGKSGWAKMPATMIRKVALVHCLREAFPDDFQGLYAAEEMGKVGEQAAKLEEAPAPQAIEAEAVIIDESPITDEQINELDEKAKRFAEIRGGKKSAVYDALMASATLQAAGVESGNMTAHQADLALKLLDNWIAKAQAAAAQQAEAQPVACDADGVVYEAETQELASEDIPF